MDLSPPHCCCGSSKKRHSPRPKKKTPRKWQYVGGASPRCSSSTKRRLESLNRRRRARKWLAEAQARTAAPPEQEDCENQFRSLIGAAALSSDVLMKAVTAGVPSSAASCCGDCGDDSAVERVPATPSPVCSPLCSPSPPEPSTYHAFTTPVNQCRAETECRNPSSSPNSPQLQPLCDPSPIRFSRGTKGASTKRKSRAKSIVLVELLTPAIKTTKSLHKRGGGLLAAGEDECERGIKEQCSMFSNIPLEFGTGTEVDSARRKSSAKLRHKAKSIGSVEVLTPAIEARKSLCTSIIGGGEACERGSRKGQFKTIFSHVPPDDEYYAGDSSGGSEYVELKNGTVIVDGRRSMPQMISGRHLKTSATIVRENLVETMLSGLKQASTMNLIRRHRGKEASIDQWEREKTAKATQKMKEYEMELDKKREKAQLKCQRQIYNAQKEAEKKKFKEQAAINKKTLIADKAIKKLSATGKVPWGIMCL